MKNAILSCLVLMILLPLSTHAEEIYTNEPRCAIFKNETKDTMFVGVRTDFYTKPDGTRSYYESVMKIRAGNMQQACVKGPFFPGYKVALMIKSFFPLFECQTKLQGDIFIREKPKASGEGRDFYATCIE